jgi:hypothetical protein
MNKEFKVHRLNASGITKAQEIARIFDSTLDAIKGYCNGREFAIVTTKLEEACFFAKKGMASLPINQDTGE